MNMRNLIVCLVAIVTLPVMAYGQPTCAAPRLSDQQVKNIIDGIGLMGHDDHSPGETADLTTLPSQTKRAAVLLYRLTRGMR